MYDISLSRKNKINLSDFDYKKDIENRLSMAQFTQFDIEVLEEILYSSVKIPLLKLSKNLNNDLDKILSSLEKFQKAGLLKIQNDLVIVDKEMRKYYEFQILKFDDEFKPDMEFLQGLLRKVPIHFLPIWYSIPRTSNNIFESILEKYLITPHVFQRYLFELYDGDPVFAGIIQEVYHSPEFKVDSNVLKKKYDLSDVEFEEYMLLLEFSFVCCLSYNKVDDHWKEVVTPFFEWSKYLQFIENSETNAIPDTSSIKRERPKDFSFVEDMTALLNFAQKEPIPIFSQNDESQISDENLEKLIKLCNLPPESWTRSYLYQLIQKLCLIRLADRIDGCLCYSEASSEWLSMSIENRALYLYRHPSNRILSNNYSNDLCNEKNIRECEKTIKRVVHRGWVYFDDFFKGVIASLNEETTVKLRRKGRNWHYLIPHFNEEQKKFIKATIFEWLFEMGMVAIGTHDSKDCFCVTPFGQTFFE